MFDTSFFLLLWALGINLILPLSIGILTLWAFFGGKYHGILLYVLGFFLGTGVVAYSLFNLQFFHMGIGVGEYLFLQIILILIIGIRIFRKDFSIQDCISSLSVKNKFSEIRHSFQKLSHIQKIFTLCGALFVGIFFILSFLFTANFPSYADDSFTNWHRPSFNIYYDDGVQIFGPSEEILGRARLGYPIYIPLYKALIADIFGEWNDIYANLWQYLSFLFFIIGITVIGWKRTENIFFSLLPSIFITGLPLVFFHVVEGYLDLACALYSVWTIYFLFLFLEKRKNEDLVLAVLFAGILAHLKNDGLVVYLFAILFAFVLYAFFIKELKNILYHIGKQPKLILLLGSIIGWFILPFMVLKQYYHLGYNQAAGNDAGVGISSDIHWEIFSVFPALFFQADNYNISLLLIIGLIFIGFKKKMAHMRFFIISGISLFCVFLAVFLFTENYRWVLDQTTVNRVFTMVFVILFSFIGLIGHAYQK